jgi:hypothetical protein
MPRCDWRLHRVFAGPIEPFPRLLELAFQRGTLSYGKIRILLSLLSLFQLRLNETR